MALPTACLRNNCDEDDDYRAHNRVYGDDSDDDCDDDYYYALNCDDSEEDESEETDGEEVEDEEVEDEEVEDEEVEDEEVDDEEVEGGWSAMSKRLNDAISACNSQAKFAALVALIMDAWCTLSPDADAKVFQRTLFDNNVYIYLIARPRIPVEHDTLVYRTPDKRVRTNSIEFSTESRFNVSAKMRGQWGSIEAHVEALADAGIMVCTIDTEADTQALAAIPGVTLV